MPTTEELESWWGAESTHGIGLVTGKLSGVVVIDDDRPKHNTKGVFKPSGTVSSQTGSGGWHYFYKYPDFAVTSSASQFEKHIDLRGDGGYVVLPPSENEAGPYVWSISPFDMELADFPLTAEELIPNKEHRETRATFDPSQTVTEGARHESLKKACAYFWNKVGPANFEQQVNTWNQNCCEPSLPTREVENMCAWTNSNFEEPKEKRTAKSDKLMKLIEKAEGVVFFKDQYDEAYVRIPFKKTHVNVPIFSHYFDDFVRYTAYKAELGGVSEVLLKEIAGALSARARFDGLQHTIHYRVARVRDTFVYDLANDIGTVVEVDKDGWRLSDYNKYPFVFRKGDGAKMVTPKEGGDLKQFAKYMNLESEEAKMLYISLLPTRMVRDIDQMIGYIHGPAGSAKSTLLRFTQELLDPVVEDVAVPISKIDDLQLVLSQGWMLAYDNTFRINDDMSAFLCTVATGGSASVRKLYSNTEKVKMHFKNPMYFTGINIEIHQSDLHSRTIAFKTRRLSDTTSANQEKMLTDFNLDKPHLLGAIFDAVSKAMAVKDKLPQDVPHRMKSCALWAQAVAKVLGYDVDHFRATLKRSVEEQAYEAAYGIGTGRLIMAFMEDHEHWSGTMTELYEELRTRNRNDDLQMVIDENYPKNEASLGRKMRDIENSLLKLGIRVDFHKPNNKTRTVTLKRASEETKDSADSNIVKSDESEPHQLVADCDGTCQAHTSSNASDTVSEHIGMYWKDTDSKTDSLLPTETAQTAYAKTSPYDDVS